MFSTIRNSSICLSFISAMVPAIAQAATVVALHSGANDPTSEGWDTLGFPANNSVTTGPVINDLGTGIDAWRIEDRGVQGGDIGWYFYQLTPEQLSNALTFGWELSVLMRNIDAPDPASPTTSLADDASPFFGVRTGTATAQVHLHTEADGDPILSYLTGFSPNTTADATVQGAGGGYHRYVMAFDPLSGISVSMDGNSIFTGLSGVPVSTTTTILFGAGSSCCVGQGHFAEVQFTTFEPSPVPGPASLPLLAGGLLLAGFVARRRRASA